MHYNEIDYTARIMMDCLERPWVVSLDCPPPDLDPIENM